MMLPAKKFARFDKIRQIEDTRKFCIATVKELDTLLMNSSKTNYMRHAPNHAIQHVHNHATQEN